MPVDGVKDLLADVEERLTALALKVNLAFRTRHMRVDRLARLLRDLVRDQTRSTVDVVRKLQRQKAKLTIATTTATTTSTTSTTTAMRQGECARDAALALLTAPLGEYDDDGIDAEIVAMLARGHEADAAAARAAASAAAVEANLRDLAKVPWVPTAAGETSLRLRFHEVLRDCLAAHDCSRVMDVYGQLLRQHVRPDTTTFQLMVLVCKRALPPDPELAIKVFEEMRRSDFVQAPPTLQMYNQMIEACAEPGAWRKALRMFKALVDDPQRLRPNGSTYKALTKAAQRANFKDAPAIYEAMKLYGVPEYISFNAATRAFVPRNDSTDARS